MAQTNPQQPTSEAHSFYLYYAGLCACDASDVPEASQGMEEDDILDCARPHQVHVLELFEQDVVEVRVARDSRYTRSGTVDIPSGRLYIASTEMLDGSPVVEQPGEGMVVEVEPGRWAVGFEVTGREPHQVVVHLHRVGPVGTPTHEPRDTQRSVVPNPPPATPDAHWVACEPTSRWHRDRVDLRVEGEASAPPRLLVVFQRDGQEVERSEPTALWFKDGAWEYQLWLLGPRSGADAIRVWTRR